MTAAARFNPNHGAPGSGHGGQFTSAGSGGSGGKGAKTDAHQAHAAHEQYLANHPDTPGARTQRKAALLEQAKADRAKAKVLEKQLKGLDQQEAKAAQAAKHAKAAAANAKAGPRQKRNLAHAAASRHKGHATLKSRISGLRDQIAGLLDKAKALEAQAAKL